MTTNLSADIVIIGGGIAGLWTLARLRQDGYQAILLEADQLACIQSGASQGIIHGGTKYALTGKLTHSAESIQEMPKRWKDCLNGEGEVDLRQAEKLSNHQYLWSNKSLASKITGFFASKVMTSRMHHLKKKDYVSPFDQSDFNGELYQLDEPVLDIKSVINSLKNQFSEFIFQFNVKEIKELKNTDGSQVYNISLKEKVLHSKALILTAGSGNEALLKSLELEQPQMQCRPLLMPMLKGKKNQLPKMYAHCLGASALPKMTITSHQREEETVWYLGGEIAESGVGRSVEEQTNIAKKELQSLMPWMDFKSCQWSALAVDRAEPKMPDGSRPVEPAVFRTHQVITAWPVKLAMAPIMVDKIMQELKSAGIEKKSTSQPVDKSAFEVMQCAETGPLPWEKIQHWLS